MYLLRNFLFLAAVCVTHSCFGVAHAPFVIITPEKTGTHLLTKAITKIIDKPVRNIWAHNLTRRDLEYALLITEAEGEILHAHSQPSFQVIHLLQELGYKVLFLKRDPRDQLLSALFFVRNDNWSVDTFDRYLPFGMLSFDEQLSEMITGKLYGVSMLDEITTKFLPWKNQPEDFVLTTSFEDLVGASAGEGGSNEEQFHQLQKICQFLDIEKTDAELNRIAGQLYGKPGEKTFRQGKIGRWKKYFKEIHKEEFKEKLGKELIELNYEQDYNW
jgi:hypothetical protein